MNRQPLIALPKGRLFDQSLGLLAKAGVPTMKRHDESRKLTFQDDEGRYEFVALKPVDIPVYVESGAVDAGIVGTDILREVESDVYEPLDLQIGKCRLVLAGPNGVDLDFSRHVRVATKYPHTAERFFRSKNAHVHIVRLDGSVEIAPLLGLADAIIDLVETGRTLQENNMQIFEEIAPVTGKLIVNRTAMKLKSAPISSFIAQLDAVIYANS
jgi:ATP phosphoribosyltransferase